MKTKAILMTIAMMSAALAGCTGSDGVAEIDDATLQELFDDNIQDFMNNTSIIVNQEIHYHNNTTHVVDDGDYSSSVVNEYNNTTNIDGGEVVNNYEQNDHSNTNYSLGGSGVAFGDGMNGTISGSSLLFVAHLEFTAMDIFPDYEEPGNPEDNIFTYDYGYYDYLTNSDRNDTFTFPCSVYYIVGSQSPNGSNNTSNQVSYWEDSGNYHNAWEQMYNSTVANLLHEAAHSPLIISTCSGDFPTPLATGSDEFYFEFLSIDIPMGYAIEYVQYHGVHRFYGCSQHLSNSPSWDACVDTNDYYNVQDADYWNFDEGPSPLASNELYGGWENTSVEFTLDTEQTYGSCYSGNNYLGYSCYKDYGLNSVWPTSEYEFTLYYRFVPVVPVE